MEAAKTHLERSILIPLNYYNQILNNLIEEITMNPVIFHQHMKQSNKFKYKDFLRKFYKS